MLWTTFVQFLILYVKLVNFLFKVLGYVSRCSSICYSVVTLKVLHSLKSQFRLEDGCAVQWKRQERSS